MESEILKHFTRGLAQSDLSAFEESPETNGERDYVERTTAGFIAHLYSQNSRIFKDILASEKKQPARTDSFAPIGISMRFAAGSWDDLLKEYLHLCDKYGYKIHPATLPWILSKKRDFRTVARIATFLPTGLNSALEKWFPEYLAGRDLFQNKQPTAGRIKNWIWSKIITSEKAGFTSSLESIWPRLSTANRIAAIKTIPPGYFHGLPHFLEKDLPYSSQKLNRALIYLSLSSPEEEIKQLISRDLRRFVFTGELELTSAFRDLCDLLKVEEVEPLLREIAGIFPPGVWLREEERKKLAPKFENGDIELLRNIFYAAMWSGNSDAALLADEQTKDTRDFRKLFQNANSPFEIRISPAFFNKLAGHFLKTPNPHKLVRLSLFLPFYHGLWADSVSVKLLTSLKDSGHKLFESEKGIETGKTFCNYLQTRANPTLLPHLEKNAIDRFNHPLAEDFQKTIQYWQERKAMRISFAKSSNN